MGTGKFFLKNCASPINKDLLNETTFGLIHLAGQYLFCCVKKDVSQRGMLKLLLIFCISLQFCSSIYSAKKTLV
jgi:hypothetical protein